MTVMIYIYTYYEALTFIWICHNAIVRSWDLWFPKYDWLYFNFL